MTQLHLNRKQRRQLRKKLRQKEPPSLAEWLSSPDKVVKRGELWAVLDRWGRIRDLRRRYYSWPQRLKRWLQRWNPLVEDPPPDPFQMAEAEEAEDVG